MRMNEIEAIVEIPTGSRNKYEYDSKAKVIRLDRVLLSSVRYPVDYGYFPNTKAPDGDPLDVMILVEEPTFPGCHIFVRLVGVLLMEDEKGMDEKILAVPTVDQRFKDIHDIKDIPQHRLDEIENFFVVYKDLEEGNSEVKGWRDTEHAREIFYSSFQESK